MTGSLNNFIYFAGATITIFTALYFTFSLPKKTISHKLFIIHLLSLGLFVLLMPLGRLLPIPPNYRLYIRMFFFAVISAPLLFLAVRSMKKQLNFKQSSFCILIGLTFFLLYIFAYHKKLFNHFNIFDLTQQTVVTSATHHFYDSITRGAQILASSFFLMAAIQAFRIRQTVRLTEQQQLTQIAYGGTIFFALFTLATIFAEWMWSYYGALINAFFVTRGIWLQSRDMHKSLTKVDHLLQMEAATFLTRFRHHSDKLSALLQITHNQGLPDRVMVIREAVGDNTSVANFSENGTIDSFLNENLTENCIITPTDINELSIILNSSLYELNSESKAATFCENLHNQLAVHGLKASIGCGEKKSFENLPDSYREAISALNYTNSLTDTVAVHIKDIPHVQEKELFPYNLKNSLLEEVSQGNITSAERLFTEILPILKHLSLGHDNVLRIRVHDLVIAIIETGLSVSADREFLSQLNEKYFEIIHNADNRTYVEEAFTIMRKVCEMINNSRESYHDTAIKRAIEFIEDNFNEDISVGEAAEEAALCSSYFMALLKKATGMTFTDYLRHIRIREAKRLIKETDMNMTEIANAVGIPNPPYFSKQFKTVEGITPSQFKKQN